MPVRFRLVVRIHNPKVEVCKFDELGAESWQHASLKNPNEVLTTVLALALEQAGKRALTETVDLGVLGALSDEH